MTSQNAPTVSVDNLNKRFSVPGVTLEPGNGGLSRVAVRNSIAEADIYLHGAHVTRFQPRGQSDVMFVSQKSHYAAGKAIRGGVPLIFPWFGPKADDAKAPQHGFVRNQPWTVRDIKTAADGAVAIQFGFGPSEMTRAIWPFEFEVLYTVTVGKTLTMQFEVHNTGKTDFKFEAALHTYLAVSDVRKATIDGLGGRDFLDKVDGAKRKTQPAGPFSLIGETDRVYLNTPDTVIVKDPAEPRTISVEKTGSASTVVWNPWTVKAQAMADFGPDEWPKMLCIETANANENAVMLSAGKMHSMTAVIRSE